MATIDNLRTPQQIYADWRDRITALAQALDSLEIAAETYDRRPNYFDQFKYAEVPGPDSPEQLHNNEVQWYADQTLEMVYFWNRLRDNFLTPENLAVLGRQRTDL